MNYPRETVSLSASPITPTRKRKYTKDQLFETTAILPPTSTSLEKALMSFPFARSMVTSPLVGATFSMPKTYLQLGVMLPCMTYPQMVALTMSWPTMIGKPTMTRYSSLASYELTCGTHIPS